LTDSLFT